MSREQDARVAELVMGWMRIYGRAGVAWSPPEKAGASTSWAPPHYTTDPAADYEVLEHVRQNWEPMRVCALRDELEKAWWQRAYDTEQTEGARNQVFGCTQYRPGDYSRAALAAVEKEQQHGA